MSKSSPIFICDSCGNELSKWVGQCPFCHAWNSIKELNLPKEARGTSNRPTPQALTPAAATKSAPPVLPTSITEFDRVLGTGLTQGGIFLLAGQPGIGKSTLLTQLAINLSAQKHSVLYICSEENPSQVATRISRLSTKVKETEHINLLGTDVLEDILSFTNKALNPPALIIIDSIQSISSDKIPGAPGSLSQIRSCSAHLIHLAKTRSIPIILVGHVTKEGSIAGPKLLEHMVDAVLQLEGDRHHDLRLLRGLKNRFGPTDETGIFQMTSSGMDPILNPGELFLSSSSAKKPGSTLTLIMEGTRPLLVEVQALTVPTELPIPRRIAQGIPLPRLQLICAILTKHLGLNLNSQDVFVNITGGLTLKEPAADLAIALAILSSYKGTPLPKASLAIGELGLLGEIRPVPYLDKRLKEAKTLGYNAKFTPKDFSFLSQIKL